MSYERYFCNVIFSTFLGGCHIDWGKPFFFIINVLFFRRGGEKCRNNGGFLSISILFAVGFGPVIMVDFRVFLYYLLFFVGKINGPL